MTAAQVVLWRHGETDYNVLGKLQGQTDVPLNQTGQEQARLGARRLIDTCTPGRIASSDLVRARDTAAALAELVGVRVVPDERLRERGFGQLEGMTRDEVIAAYPDVRPSTRSGYPAELGLEPIAAVAARGMAAIDEHVAATPDGTTLVVVAHGALLSITLDAMLGFDPVNSHAIMGLSNAHHSVVDVLDDGFRLTAHNLP